LRIDRIAGKSVSTRPDPRLTCVLEGSIRNADSMPIAMGASQTRTVIDHVFVARAKEEVLVLRRKQIANELPEANL
jgi:hypothetical protein